MTNEEFQNKDGVAFAYRRVPKVNGEGGKNDLQKQPDNENNKRGVVYTSYQAKRL